MSAQVFELFGRQVFFDVRFVVRWQDHISHTGPFGREHFFFYAADRQYIATQSDFPGHRQVRSDRAIRQQRNQRSRHRDASRRTILRNCARRHVHMNIVIREEAFLNPEPGCVRPHPGQSRLHRLLHHLTDLSGHGEATFAFHGVRFHEKDVSAGGRPSQPDRHACTFGALGDLAFGPDLDPTQKFLNDFRSYYQLFGLSFRQPSRLFAADRANRALQVAHARLPRIVPDYVPYRFFRKFNLLSRHTVFLFLTRNQILKRDVHFLFFRVALQFDDFHAVAQRLRNRIEHVRGRDEQHLRQVERYIEVVVPEGRALLGIESFEQGRSRITSKIPSYLVDLIQHEHRILGFSAADSLDDLPRQSADIGATVSTNLGLVMHAAQRNPHELAA